MAKVKTEPIFSDFRGKFGNVVVRRVYGKMVVSKAPDFSRRKLSAAQKAQVRKFADAMKYAKAALADPARRAALQARARKQSCPLIAVAVSEYFTVRSGVRS